MLKNFVAKKTKKEKLLADKRRLLAMVSEQTVVPGKVNFSLPQQPKNTFAFKPSVQETSENRQPGQPKETYAYVGADLRKIVVLTIVAICAQLVLWYLLERHWLMFF